MVGKYGLIGYPLTHSFSPVYFQEKFQREHVDAAYDLFPLATIEEFPSLLNHHSDLNGLNVTIPYKEAIIKYLDEIDEIAAKIGAVNCIDIRNGIKKGYNTDVIGFKESLAPLLLPHHKHALILGTGGAAQAVAYGLSELCISYRLVSRQADGGSINYNEVSETVIEHYQLIINTTPLGMYPNANEFPVLPYTAINTQHLLYDLIYNPGETEFLKKGKAQGAIIKNGLEMLTIQAEASWELWNS